MLLMGGQGQYLANQARLHNPPIVDCRGAVKFGRKAGCCYRTLGKHQGLLKTCSQQNEGTIAWSASVLTGRAQATVEALSEFDAEQAAAVRGVLGLHAKEYKALARGQGLPEDMPKRTLMRLWVKRLLVDEVLWQYSAFSQADPPPMHAC